MSEMQATPDGYHVCPRCGHHTSAYAGTCTVFVPGTCDADGVPRDFRYCGCDCVVAMGGESLIDRLARLLHGEGGSA